MCGAAIGPCPLWGPADVWGSHRAVPPAGRGSAPSLRFGMRAALLALPALLAALSAAVSALSDAELRSLAERLYAADRDRAAPEELRVNLQHRIDASSGAGNDYAPLP